MEDMLALHRSKLEAERQALRPINTRGSPIVPSREILDSQNRPATKRRIPTDQEHVGLKLGGYEEHQKRLREQAKLEYNEYLNNKSTRSVYQNTPITKAANHISPPKLTPKQQTPEPTNRPNIELSTHTAAARDNENYDETYQMLLERKRDAERKYRAYLGDMPDTSTKENHEEPPKKVHFEKEDEISRAVNRLDQLAAYDKELELWNKMRRSRQDRGIKSAREERKEDPVPLMPQDRSKSVPEQKPTDKWRSTVSFMNVVEQSPVDKKKAYAEELRRQMEEQKKARLQAKQEYIGSPASVAPSRIEQLHEPSPILRAHSPTRQRLADKFNKVSPPRDHKPDRAPPPPDRALHSPALAPPGPPTGYPGYPGYPPPNPYMYPPYNMYPGYMMPPQMMPGMPPGMPPMMAGMGQMNNNTRQQQDSQYDPYKFYGLDRKAGPPSSPPDNSRPSSRPRGGMNRPAPSQVRSTERPTFDSPRIDNIGMRDSPKPTKGALDPLEYAKELKRQVEEREREKTKKKEELEAYNRKIEKEAAEYNPWGRGGAGAPLKDAQGQSVANRVHMKQNAQDPLALQRDQKQARIQTPSPRPVGEAGAKHFGRVNEITGGLKQDDPAKIAAKNDYQAYLKQQIEERAALKEKEKEAARLEDEKEAARIEKERLRLKAEFEREKEEKVRKEEAQRKMNDELKRAAEERRHEQERRQKEQREKARVVKEPPARLSPPPVQHDQDHHRISPPIPTMTNNPPKSPVIPTLANKQSNFPQPPKSPAIPTIANKQAAHQPSPQQYQPEHVQEPAYSPVVPKLNLASQVTLDSEDLRPSDRRPPTNLGTVDLTQHPSGEVSKEHVMNQLSALRQQLNRLQNVKKEQNQTGRTEPSSARHPVGSSAFDTALNRTAKRRPPPVRDTGDLRDSYDLFGDLDSLGEKMRHVQLLEQDNLDGQCSSEFVPCTPDPTQLIQHGSTQNNRYNRPPSTASVQSFDVHKIAERNEERLRRLENIHSDRVLKEKTPEAILDSFLSENTRPGSERSLECDVSYKPVF